MSSLFQDRFHRKEIKDESHFLKKFYYVHWNPQKHKYAEDYKNWDHSSFKVYLSGQKTFLPRTEILNSFGGKSAFVSDHDNVLKKWQEEFNYSKNKYQD